VVVPAIVQQQAKKKTKKKIETNETKQKPKNELTAVLRDISKAFINNSFTW
jgi:hypothetical protein